MIKKTKNTKQQLLRKNSTDSQTPPFPFQLEDSYSAVGHEDRDGSEREHSYYCLEKDLVNPYFIEMMDRKGEKEERIGGGGQGAEGREGKDRVEPVKIVMNGNCYVRVGDDERKVVEEIKALCGACQTMQLIPKNSPKFICYNCRTVNGCPAKQKKPQIPHSHSYPELPTLKSPTPTPAALPSQPSTPTPTPKLKLFKCGTCLSKVQYESGISQYIQCGRCQTVNFVGK